MPTSVCSRSSLYDWLRSKSNNQQALNAVNHQLTLDKTQWADTNCWRRAEQQFPAEMQIGHQVVQLVYSFNPGGDNDGVTARVPLTMLATLPTYRFDWLVPGMLFDKVVEMLRLLPKAQRKALVPLPDCARKLLESLNIEDCIAQNKSLVQVLEAQLKIYYSASVNPRQWQQDCDDRLDNYYRMHFEILDTAQRVVRRDDRIHQIQRDLVEQTEKTIAQADTSGIEREGITRWDFGDLNVDHSVTVEQSGITAYPALIDCKDSVAIKLLASADEALMESRLGILRLAMLHNRDRTRYLKKQLKQVTVPVLPYVTIGKHDELLDDLIAAAIAHCCFDDFTHGLPVNAHEFERQLSNGESQIVATAQELERLLHDILKKYQLCCDQLQKKCELFPLQCTDIKAQLVAMLSPGFLQRTGVNQLRHIPRYLEAVLVRFERLGGNVKTDDEYCEKLSSYDGRLQNLLYKYPHALFSDANVFAYRWLLEELRVSLFAQRLKTSVPVSFQRIRKAWEKIDQTRYPLAN